MIWALMTVALAGYGDAVDGFPQWIERDVHLWTNAARVAPAAFEEAYGSGGCSLTDFREAEKRPIMPLAWQEGLTEAARFHSADMADGRFVSHDSSDGTKTQARISRYYQGFTVGENVAGGRPVSGFDVVMNGWMCSPNHRSNIMQTVFEELGASGVGGYYTQVFGSRGRGVPALAMGVHSPEVPRARATLRVVAGSQSRASDVVAVLDGRPYTMDVEFGDDRLGVWGVQVDVDEGCHQYWFEGTVAGEPARFPEEGAYGWGDCVYDDGEANWFGPGSLADGDRDFAWDDEGKGCRSTPTTGWLGLLAVFALRRRSDEALTDEALSRTT